MGEHAIRYLSLYSGIGMHDLGFERAGWTCVGQVEIEPYCRAVLAKHWPHVPRWSDVRDVRADDVVARCGPMPEFAHTCHVSHFVLPAARDAVENMIENADVRELDPREFHGVAELQAAIDAFNVANAERTWWEPDGKHKVRLREAEAVAPA